MRFLPLLCLLLLLQPVQAETAPQPEPDLMSMTQDARCYQIVVTCLINGSPMRMMLDTGATHTVLHEESAARVPQAQWIDTSKIKFRGNSTQQPRLLAAALQVGPALSETHPIMVLSLNAVRSMMAEPIDGIVGMDILGQVPFTFDLAKGECYWGIPSDRQLVPLYASPDGTGRVVVQGICGKKKANMLLDTGSSVTRIIADEWAPGAGEEINASMGNVDTAQRITVQEGKPGDLELAPGVVVSGFKPILCPAGELPMLGMDALRGLTLVHVPSPKAPHGLFLLAK